MSNFKIPTYQTLAQYPVTIGVGYNLIPLTSTLLVPINTMIVIEQVTGFLAADDLIIYQYDDFLFDTGKNRVTVLKGITNPKLGFYARPLYSCKNTQTIKLNKTYKSAGIYNLTVYTDMNSKVFGWKEITVNNCK